MLRGDIDDAAADAIPGFLPLHFLDRALTSEKHPREINGYNEIPILLGSFSKLFAYIGRGIVDHDVKRPPPPHDFANEMIDIVPTSDISRDKDRVTASVEDLGKSATAALLWFFDDIGDPHMCAAVCKLQRNGSTNP
jgi:hypothetical protein